MPNTDRNPQNGTGGSSYIYEYGTTPNTRTAVSQKVRIMTPHYGEYTSLHQLGVLSSINPSQSKTVEEVRGVGFGDHIAELVPSITAAQTMSLERALLYLCNLWQATGYAAGIDGPVRSIAHHRWPFDIEQQLVFSTLADNDLAAANTGHTGTGFEAGVKAISYPLVTDSSANPQVAPGANPGHTAIITIYEACWFTSWSTTFAKDSGLVMESGDVMVSDAHDFASIYGEFLATGNDPTVGQLGSIRFGGNPAGGTQIGAA